MTPDDLLRCWSDPVALGREASRIPRSRVRAPDRIRALDPVPADDRPAATILRHGDRLRCEAWPGAATWHEDDRVVVRVEASADGRRAFATWLCDQARAPVAPETSLAPFSADAAACIRFGASRRPASPSPAIRIDRHDPSVRLARSPWLGADTYGGPLLPIAPCRARRRRPARLWCIAVLRLAPAAAGRCSRRATICSASASPRSRSASVPTPSAGPIAARPQPAALRRDRAPTRPPAPAWPRWCATPASPRARPRLRRCRSARRPTP